jgi:hypothetical protein
MFVCVLMAQGVVNYVVGSGTCGKMTSLFRLESTFNTELHKLHRQTIYEMSV